MQAIGLDLTAPVSGANRADSLTELRSYAAVLFMGSCCFGNGEKLKSDAGEYTLASSFLMLLLCTVAVHTDECRISGWVVHGAGPTAQ